MNIPNMGYAIANWYNVILVCLSSRQNITIFHYVLDNLLIQDNINKYV